MVGKKQPHNDRTRLSKEANAALDAQLPPGEEVEVIIPGTNGSALVGTGGLGFIWLKGRLYIYPYENLSAVAFGDGFFKWVQFRGPAVGRIEPSIQGGLVDGIQVRGFDQGARAKLTLLVASGARAFPGADPGIVSSDEAVRQDDMPGNEARLIQTNSAGGHQGGPSGDEGQSSGTYVVFRADERLVASIPMQLGRVAHLTSRRIIIAGREGGSWRLGAIDRVDYGTPGGHALEFSAYEDERREGKSQRLFFAVAGSSAAEAFVRQVATSAAEAVVAPGEQVMASLSMRLARFACLTTKRLVVTGPGGGSWPLGAIDRVAYEGGGLRLHDLTFQAYVTERREGKPRRVRFPIPGSPAAESFVRQLATLAAAQDGQPVQAVSSYDLRPAPAAEPIAVAPADLDLLCTECWTTTRGHGTDTVLSCPRCLVVYRFVKCSHCSSTDQIKAETSQSWKCAFCGGTNEIMPGDQGPRPTLDQRYREVFIRGLLSGEPDVRLVGAFTVVGGSGFELRPASVCSVLTTPASIRIAGELGDRGLATEIPYGEITTLAVKGGAVTTGPHFIGGGFGLGGAAQGIVAAKVLNDIFQRTMMTTLMRITTIGGEVWLHHGTLTSEAIRLKLSPLWVRYEAARRGDSATTAPAPSDPTLLLARLRELHDAGVLTDDEFAAKKADLLGRM